MGGEFVGLLAASSVEDADLAILAAGGDALAVGADGDGAGQVGGGELAQVFGGGKIPEADAVVGAGGGELRAVGADGDGENELLVTVGSTEGLDLLARGDAPDLDGRVAAGGEEELSIGTEGDAVDRFPVALEGGDDAAGRLVGGQTGDVEGSGAEQDQGGEGKVGTHGGVPPGGWWARAGASAGRRGW
jgi:hypothetical protein